MKRIAVWNTAFLGDAILTLPLLQNLHAAYPNATIDFYVRGGVASLFTHSPFISNVKPYDKRGKQKGFNQVIAMGKQLERAQYDAFICAHTSFRSGLLTRLSKAAVRIGYTETPASYWWYTNAVPRNFGTSHEISRLLSLLSPLHIPVTQTQPKLIINPAEVEAAKLYFASLPFPVLGIHPGSAWETKRWPAENFAEVAIWAMRNNIGVMLFAGPGEHEEARTVANMVRTAVGSTLFSTHFIDMAGKLNLVKLAAHIGCLHHYVTNDSGPMHIAWTQEVPVTGIFGPTVEQFGFYPQGKNAHVVEVDLSCRPCGLHGGKTCPKGHHNCMRLIQPEDVLTYVQGSFM